MGENIINSVADFITKLKKNELDEGYVRYYRGERKNYGCIKAGIFRDGNKNICEHEIYNDIINKRPEEFDNCKTTFEHLVKMQHYGAPTRLLDITSNPLVALFFACYFASQKKEEKAKEAPIVYLMDIKENIIKNHDSDSITLLSNLARFDDNNEIDKQRSCKRLILDFIDIELANLFEDKNEKIIKDDDIDEVIKGLEDTNKIISLPNEKKDITDKDILEHTEYFKQKCNKLKEGIKKGNNITKGDLIRLIKRIEDSRLLHNIRQDRPHFQDCMNLETFEEIYCVKPKLDNQRIIRQSGAFLIFPHREKKIDEKNNEKDNIKFKSIRIKTSKIEDILEDLNKLDINLANLYGDFSVVCKSIVDEHKKKKK